MSDQLSVIVNHAERITALELTASSQKLRIVELENHIAALEQQADQSRNQSVQNAEEDRRKEMRELLDKLSKVEAERDSLRGASTSDATKSTNG